MKNSSNTISLSDLQVWMKWIITDPRGVKDALKAPSPIVGKYSSRYTEPSVSGLALISSQASVSAIDRLNIYAEAYFSRLVESLEIDFYRVYQVLGDLQFQKLVAEYLKAHPSKSFSIGEVGKNLPEFVLACDHLKSFPFLPALASMEWQLIEVFYSADVSQVDSLKINHLSEGDWPNLVLEINPSARVLHSPWPLDQFWTMSDFSDLHKVFPMDIEQPFLIWNHAGNTQLSKISKVELVALSSFRDDQPLSQVLEKLSALFLNEASINLEESVMSIFCRWMNNGLISDLKTITQYDGRVL